MQVVAGLTEVLRRRFGRLDIGSGLATDVILECEARGNEGNERGEVAQVALELVEANDLLTRYRTTGLLAEQGKARLRGVFRGILNFRHG